MKTKSREQVAYAKTLRLKCIDAHNLLFQQTGHSLLWEVQQALQKEVQYTLNTPVHYTLSNVAFWGSAEIGGSRLGIARRLERTLSGGLYGLYEAFSRTELQAFVCIDAPRGIWRELGPEPAEDCDLLEVEVITDGLGRPVGAGKEEVRVGWMLQNAGRASLLFSEVLDPAAARRIEAIARRGGWFDDLSQEVIRREYQRDLLTLLADPGWESPGLSEFFFLEPDLRKSFPRRFGKQLAYEISRHFRLNLEYWHLYFARQGGTPASEELETILEKVRRRTARSISSYRAPEIEISGLNRLVEDRAIYWYLRLREDGTVNTDEIPALQTHPVGLLGMEEEVLKELGLTPTMSILEARRHLGEGPGSQHLEKALGLHEVRLRWVSLVRAHHQSEWPRPEYLPAYLPESSDLFELTYTEIREILDELFDPILTSLSVRSLELGKSKNRIGKALEGMGWREPGEAVQIGDLPRKSYRLLDVPGIGASSLEAITEALRQLLLEWPRELRTLGGDDETREHLDQGLEELENLFR